ncbi:sterol carrier protein domain-containing protein [Lachnoclostridium sp. Marseille-P6806]|uniref:sterol carrier protein domain-containing protein n=1 Tax=Lachnoclostridium sp. Marseille-P6806 TaxID=2364793 RepID=UPI001031052A|nr:sterol carrier protein domain-containing protein [Lachnoclostridium sp. Marseille-P6806]
MDLSVLLPECDSLDRKLCGHFTARALNIDKILSVMRHACRQGQYSIHVADYFLPENTGTYTVIFDSGKVLSIVRNDADADMDVTVETFCQLAVGRIDRDMARYREGTVLYSNEALLRELFVKKPVLLK